MKLRKISLGMPLKPGWPTLWALIPSRQPGASKKWQTRTWATPSSKTIFEGFDPRDFVLFAAGAAGPTHCCGFGFLRKAESGSRSFLFPLSSVPLDPAGWISSTFTSVRSLTLLKPLSQGYLEDYEDYNAIVRDLQ